jgi:hypothetical protein
MDDVGTYREQFCEFCQDETDQLVTGDPAIARCLRCGGTNGVTTEEDRVANLLQRLKDDDTVSIAQLRKAPFGSR